MAYKQRVLQVLLNWMQNHNVMSEYKCTKEDKIDSMERDLMTLKRVVLEGNGSDSLVVMARETRDSQKQMSDNMWQLNSNVEGLMKFQTVVETSRLTKRDIMERSVIQKRWVITSLIALVLGLAGLIVGITIG